MKASAGERLGAAVCERCDAPPVVVSRWSCHRYPLGQSKGHDIALVVVGVLADEVHPAGRCPDPTRTPPVLFGKGACSKINIIFAHLQHSRLRSCSLPMRLALTRPIR